jgi:hypothetical protein
MQHTSVGIPLSDTSTMKAAIRAARRARAIAASREFDDDAVRLLLNRAEQELEEASTAAGLDEQAAA